MQITLFSFEHDLSPAVQYENLCLQYLPIINANNAVSDGATKTQVLNIERTQQG